MTAGTTRLADQEPTDEVLAAAAREVAARFQRHLGDIDSDREPADEIVEAATAMASATCAVV